MNTDETQVPDQTAPAAAAPVNETPATPAAPLFSNDDKVKLYQVLDAASAEANQLINVFADGKVTFTEVIGLVAGAQNIQILASEGLQALKAYVAAPDNVQIDAADYLGSRLELGKPEIDARVAATIDQLAHLEVNARLVYNNITGIAAIWKK